MAEEYIVWDTPLAFGKSLCLVSLVDEGHLTITVQDNRDNYRRMRIVFEYSPIYRNIEEIFRTANSINRTGSWTVIVNNSSWLAELRAHEDLIDQVLPNLRHYQIITEFDVIDVLSEREPKVEEVEPGRDVVGRAPVLYYLEDKARVEEVIDRLNRGEPPS